MSIAPKVHAALTHGVLDKAIEGVGAADGGKAEAENDISVALGGGAFKQVCTGRGRLAAAGRVAGTGGGSDGAPQASSVRAHTRGG